jgi:putative ABC transport system ATP-binding protein
MHRTVPPAIVVSNLHKAYGRGTARTPVLFGVDMQVASGECVFLVGPSGSGKSTLLSILGCVLTPDEGSVRMLGTDVGRLNSRDRTLLRRNRLGFVFQKFHLIRGLAALENVCLPLTLRGAAPRVARRRATELLERVGLGERLASHACQMSTGQCQRVALARALAGNPDVILADEPTASLDAKSGYEVMTLLTELTKDEGKTAVVVTHDHRIFEFADRILELEGGRIATESSPESEEVSPGSVTLEEVGWPC